MPAALGLLRTCPCQSNLHLVIGKDLMANSKPFVAIIVAVPFLGTLLAIALLWQRAIYWPDVALMLCMYTLTGLGLTVGYHRMLTHRSFRAHPAVRFSLLALGSMALIAPPVEFAATHLKHHAHSDRDGDPHSPLEGLFHSHLGWLWKDRFAEPQVYCRPLLADGIVVFVNRTFPLWVLLSLTIPFLLRGWTGFLWGGLVRIFLGQHVIFSVNSICHVFGRRDFDTNDTSHNHWLIGLLAMGEGWHNNHHAFPRSAFHGLGRWQLDLSGTVIQVLERLGLVYDVHRVPAAQLLRYSLHAPDPLSSSLHPMSDNTARPTGLPCLLGNKEVRKEISCLHQP